jgi:hypothetical protein
VFVLLEIFIGGFKISFENFLEIIENFMQIRWKFFFIIKNSIKTFISRNSQFEIFGIESSNRLSSLERRSGPDHQDQKLILRVMQKLSS